MKRRKKIVRNRERQRTMINIGMEFNRWEAQRLMHGLPNHEKMAKYLLDRDCHHKLTAVHQLEGRNFQPSEDFKPPCDTKDEKPTPVYQYENISMFPVRQYVDKPGEKSYQNFMAGISLFSKNIPKARTKHLKSRKDTAKSDGTAVRKTCENIQRTGNTQKHAGGNDEQDTQNQTHTLTEHTQNGAQGVVEPRDQTQTNTCDNEEPKDYTLPALNEMFGRNVSECKKQDEMSGSDETDEYTQQSENCTMDSGYGTVGPETCIVYAPSGTSEAMTECMYRVPYGSVGEEFSGPEIHEMHSDGEPEDDYSYVDLSCASDEISDSLGESTSQHEFLRRSSRLCVKKVKRKLKSVAKSLRVVDSQDLSLYMERTRDMDYLPGAYKNRVSTPKKAKENSLQGTSEDLTTSYEEGLIYTKKKKKNTQINQKTSKTTNLVSPKKMRTAAVVKTEKQKQKPTTATFESLENGTFECSFCKEVFSSGENEIEHCSKHSLFYKCNMCGNLFINGSGLTSHQRRKCVEINSEKRERHQCHICSFSCELRRPFENHMKKIHNDKKFDVQKKHLCDICGISYNCKLSFTKHMKDFHEHQCQDFVCQTCGQGFFCDRYLKRHLRTHGERNIKCMLDICQMMFYDRSTMLCHYRKNHKKKEENFVCGYENCGKKFGMSAPLRAHISSVHEKSRTIECEWPDCSKVFFSPWHLKIHMRIHTGENPISCQFCDYTCRQRAALKWHLRKHGIFNREQEKDALQQIKADGSVTLESSTNIEHNNGNERGISIGGSMDIEVERNNGFNVIHEGSVNKGGEVCRESNDCIEDSGWMEGTSNIKDTIALKTSENVVSVGKL
ncbi:hypothetical protein ScPMuIL_009170 [Solemya velum]